MRRRLIILGIVAVVAIIAVIIVVSRGGIGTQTNACQNMIIGMRNGDVEGTYAMLSESARRVNPQENWQQLVGKYHGWLEGGTETPWFISTETLEGTEDDPGNSTTMRYRFDSPTGEWDGICVFYGSENNGMGSFNIIPAGYEL